MAADERESELFICESISNIATFEREFPITFSNLHGTNIKDNKISLRKLCDCLGVMDSECMSQCISVKWRLVNSGTFCLLRSTRRPNK